MIIELRMRMSFTGTGSSGKTTLLNKCKEYYGNRFKYVDEVTRVAAKVGLTINEGGGDETQLFIIKQHITNSDLDNVIMDRCIIDGMVYTEWLYTSGTVSESVFNICRGVYFDLIRQIDIVFYTEPVQLVDDGVRSVNHKFRDEISHIFKQYISPLKRNTFPGFKGKIITLKGDVETRFNDIKLAIK